MELNQYSMGGGPGWPPAHSGEIMLNTLRARLVGLAALTMLPVAPLMLSPGAASATAFSSCGVVSGDASTGSALNSQLHGNMAGKMDAESTACARVITQTVRAHGL